MPDRRAAAVFDLDRTLVCGASGRILTGVLRRAGLLGPPRRPRAEVALYEVFRRYGETLPSVVLARDALRRARGWSRQEVRAAVATATDALAATVHDGVVPLLDEHRSAGRRLVLATTMGEDLVAPLAEHLGFDELVATRASVDAAGRYDGRLEGEFLWSMAKARAVVAWAERADVDLAASGAYSDSVFDVPLLARVGHPVAANPDWRLAALARLRGWPVLWLRPAGAPGPAAPEATGPDDGIRSPGGPG